MPDRLLKLAAIMRKPPRRSGCTSRTLQCDFWNWGGDYQRPDCCTSHLLELVRFADKLLTRNGITHWLDYGTLLGAVRNERLIPWDDDVDVGILHRDREAVLALVPEIERAGYRVDLGDPAVIRINYSAVNNQHVDLFLWKESGGLLTSNFDPDLAWPGMYDKESFPVAYVAPPQPVRLHGTTFPAPSPADRFLVEHRFGPDYMTPTRPVRSSRLYPNMRPDQLTPAAERLLDRLVVAEARLRELQTRSRLSQAGLWRDWIEMGMPLAPAPRLVEEVAATVPLDERTPTVEQLTASIAWVEDATGELQRRSPTLFLRRAGRRAVRLGRRLRG